MALRRVVREQGADWVDLTDRTTYNMALRRVARELGTDWADMADRFPVREQRLWALPQMAYISNCTGLHRLLDAVVEVCDRQSTRLDLSSHHDSTRLDYNSKFC